MNYTTEILIDGEWQFLSKHKDKEYAIINAEVTSKGRQCDSHVVHRGKTICYFRKGILKEK